ncbi:TPA: universal stress protein [Aeromonas veronii]|uniref:universal stress protein n=1 Tax=Aeromonas veronii TaxID=654 RepID=UPI000F5E3E2B|nr:universal stress protein [Aeromonas veronii]MBA2083927.1 universal stress protein [Aeromonas veronii]MCX0423766.1 universal stress protein [Aeromonas veronii]RRA93671.1 universal stress protein [Aeromonas veronii bv. sobria]TNI70422.1 universal stress protein [Aeromonas veronii]WIJ40232.1 universal stress protein [Aeromonas veronii]
MPSIKTLLCPVDFSQMSKAVLDYAVFMAQSHDARLKLVHVVDQLHGFDSYKILHMTAVEITHEMERQARTQLKELVATLPIPATFDIRFGRAADEIVIQAKEDEVELIVMGSHGRSGISHLLVGSVAESVVRHAPCPVLVVRQ